MAAKEKRPKEDLRKRLFASLYVGRCHLNATDAARAAGYKGTDGSLATLGSRLLADPAVRELVAQHAEAAAVSEREIVGLLAAHMRGTMGDLLSFDDVDEPHLDLGKAKAANKLGLIKSFKETRHRVKIAGRKGDDDTVSETVTYEVKLYDAQAAADKLAKVVGLYQPDEGERLQPAEGDMTDEEWVEHYERFRIPRGLWIPGIRRLYEQGKLRPAKQVESRQLPGGEKEQGP